MDLKRTVFILFFLLLCIFFIPYFIITSSAQIIPRRANQTGLFYPIDIGLSAPNEIILRIRPGVSWVQFNALLNIYGLVPLEINFISGIQRVVTPSNNVLEIVARLNLEPIIEFAEPNFIIISEFIPNDPYFIYQWNFSMIDTELAWDFSIGSNVIVAVVDSGVAYANQGVYAQAPDLAGTLFVPGWDFVNEDAFPDDDNGHGTHITGTIAQTTNNFEGVAGIAHGAAIMPIKVLDADSSGLVSDIAEGIYFAVNNGAQIINMSFGTYTDSVTLQDAIDYAYLNGVSVICSAGNNATDIPHFPSSYPTCVCVTAVRYDQTRPFYANYGPDIDICAPGGDLVFDLNLDGQKDGIVQQTHDGTNFTVFNYALFQGSSCAAAHASGVAAMVLSVAPIPLTPDEVKATLENTSIDIGPVGWDEDSGWGLLNAFNAVESVLPIAAVAAASPLLNLGFSPFEIFFRIGPLYPIIFF
ncbi:MAG: S8 family peptidase [bacterium]